MHISEGVLSAPVLAGGWVICAGLLAFSLRRIKETSLPRMAVFASAFFLASLIRVPIGAASAHFALVGLMGLALGWGAFPAMLLSLALQALLFQFGGLVALGVNATLMGGSAVLMYVLFGRLCASGANGTHGRGGAADSKRVIVGGFLAGFCGIAVGVGLVCAALVVSHAELSTTAAMLAAANLPLAVAEGVVTAFAVMFLRKVAPDMLATACV